MSVENNYIKAGVPHGSGVFTEDDGVVWMGSFQHGLPHNYVLFIWPDGDKGVGRYDSNGVRHGCNVDVVMMDVVASMVVHEYEHGTKVDTSYDDQGKAEKVLAEFKDKMIEVGFVETGDLSYMLPPPQDFHAKTSASASSFNAKDVEEMRHKLLQMQQMMAAMTATTSSPINVTRVDAPSSAVIAPSAISRDMRPIDLANLLRAEGQVEAVVRAFLDNGVTGEVVMDGLSDADLLEMGVASAIQRRSVLSVIRKLVDASSAAGSHSNYDNI